MLQELGGMGAIALASVLSDSAIQEEVGEALTGIGPSGAEALATALQDRNSAHKRRAAAIALGSMGMAASSHAEALGVILRDDEDASVKREAARALSNMEEDG